MDRRRTRPRLAAPHRGPVAGALSLALAVTLVLAGCSGGSDEPQSEGDPTASGSTAEADEPYLPVPDGVELTAQGSDLSFGEAASVAWRPKTTTTGVLDVTVRAVQRAPLSAFSGFRLDQQTRSSAAYFVRVRIENTGASDLSGAAIPLYLVDETNTLIQASSFASRFAPCPSRPFPRGFTPGERVTTCLVYLAPDQGDAEGVSFRPAQSFDPIVWTGEETRYQPSKQQGKQGKQRKQKQQKKQEKQDQ